MRQMVDGQLLPLLQLLLMLTAVMAAELKPFGSNENFGPSDSMGGEHGFFQYPNFAKPSGVSDSIKPKPAVTANALAQNQQYNQAPHRDKEVTQWSPVSELSEESKDHLVYYEEESRREGDHEEDFTEHTFDESDNFVEPPIRVKPVRRPHRVPAGKAGPARRPQHPRQQRQQGRPTSRPRRPRPPASDKPRRPAGPRPRKPDPQKPLPRPTQTQDRTILGFMNELRDLMNIGK